VLAPPALCTGRVSGTRSCGTVQVGTRSREPRQQVPWVMSGVPPRTVDALCRVRVACLERVLASARSRQGSVGVLPAHTLRVETSQGCNFPVSPFGPVPNGAKVSFVWMGSSPRRGREDSARGFQPGFNPVSTPGTVHSRRRALKLKGCHPTCIDAPDRAGARPSTSYNALRPVWTCPQWRDVSPMARK
jgi:hypothetical protein